MQLCGKHISVAVNQQATIEGTVFFGGTAPSLYNEDLTQLERDLRCFAVVVRGIESSSGVGSCSRELRESAVEGDWNNGKKGVRLHKEDFMCDLKLHVGNSDL
jgi:hypothetical protein